jgi:signal transduction histidine kinase
MVNNLLDVSKIESGRMSLSKSSCTIHEILQERLPMYRQSAAMKTITIHANRCRTLPEINVDRSKILQVLDNLISNAIKFSFPESTIRIQTTHDDEFVHVAVIDKGQGIPENECHKLFEPFSKTSVRSTAGESSTGLGLAICRKIIEAHGGTIHVDSEVGKGSTFYFTLPLYSPQHSRTKHK